MLYAWLESCSPACGASASSVNVWVKLPNGIGASSTLTIYLAIFSFDEPFDANFWGEAPELSTTYSTPSVNSQSSNSATNAKSVTCTINASNVGDLLYAQIVPDQLAPAGVTITDSQNNHYSYHSQTGIFVTWVAAVAASTTGPDTITFSNTNTIPALDIFCYDVSGVSTALGAFSQTSALGVGPSTTMTVPAFNTFSKAGFTAALYDEFTSRSVSITAGSGFTQATGSPINDGYQLMASQYSTTTTGSTQCPMSVSASESWIAECDNFAPTPSAGSYGRYDNGANVFTFYDDFAGTGLNTAKWNAPVILSNPDSGPASFSVSDGLTLSATGASIAGGPYGAVHVYSKNTYSNNVYDVYYGQESDSCPGGCRQDTEAFLGALLTPPISTCHPTTGPSACAGHGTGYLSGWGTFYPWIIIGASPANTSLYTTTNAAWPNAPFTLYWQSGSEILYAGYTQRLSWTDTSNVYGANYLELDANAWRGSITVTAFWARARAIPPNNVMPSATVVVGDLQVVSVEPVQAVFGAKAVVAGKPTVIRVDVKSTFQNFVETQLQTTYNGNVITDTIIIPPNCEKGEKVFYLPSPITTLDCKDSVSLGTPIAPSGSSLDVSVQIDPNNVITPSDASKKTISVITPVKSTSPVKVHLVPISLTTGSPNPLTAQQLDDIRTVGSALLDGTFPVNPTTETYEIGTEYRYNPCKYVIFCFQNESMVQDMLQDLSSQAYLSDPLNDNLRYVGVVQEGWFKAVNASGVGQACPRHFTLGNDQIFCFAYKGVLAEGSPVGNLTVPLGPATITHEIGHTYGFDEGYEILQNGGCVSIRPTTGYWVTQSREMPSIEPQAYDFMGCRNAASGPQSEVWITTDHYNRLLACLKTGAICSAGITLVDPEVLLLRGVLLKDGTMLLGPMYDVPAGIPELPPNASGNFTLEFRASDGSLLSSTSFVLGFSDVVEGYKVQLDEVPFGFSVALPPATYSIQIQHAGKVLVNVTPDSNFLKSAISSLPDKAFDKNPDQRRNALLNKIDAFDKMLAKNDINGALQKLQNDIKPHVQEWVADYQKDNPLQLSRTEILQLIDRIIARLSAQSGTTSGNPHTGSGFGRENFGRQLFCISSCPEGLNDVSPTIINRINSIMQLIMDDLRQFGSLAGLRTGFAVELTCATRDYFNLLSSFVPRISLF